MSRPIAFFAVLIVVFINVLFGLDWQAAPLTPMPETKATYAPPPPAPALAVTPPPTPIQRDVPNAAPNVAIPDNSATENATPIAQTPSKPKCDVIACSSAYRSFQESDCTYQPSNGPRRLCTKGVVVSEPSAVPNAATTSNMDAETNAQSNMQCNVTRGAACIFQSSDCTTSLSTVSPAL
jgi:hypothetical protein